MINELMVSVMFSEGTLLELNAPIQEESIIKVFGVGGGGSNAVNHMCRQGIRGVEFVICNTDIQALRISPVKNRIQIGKELTEGRGAGSLPERRTPVGRGELGLHKDDSRA